MKKQEEEDSKPIEPTDPKVNFLVEDVDDMDANKELPRTKI